MKIAETATGVHGVRLSNSSIVIVEFILRSIAKEGTPAKVLYTYLQGCFTINPRRLKFIRFKFDIDAENLGPHQDELMSLVQSLKECDSFNPCDSYRG